MNTTFEKIAVVDDDPVIRRMLVGYLQGQGIPVTGFANGQQFLDEQNREPCDLIILDLQLPDYSGLELMQMLKKADSTAEFIIITGFGTIESAVEAMKMGSSNYLLKPFTIAQFVLALNQLLEQKNLRKENFYLKEQLDAESFGGALLYNSPEMTRACGIVNRVAPTNATVLIEGESGTGKELIARLIHQKSHRADKPYIKINCAAVSENLLESEFFGHEKGAFTGAVSRREGRFELASGGTLLLDEVTEINLNLQSKLLRVLQEQEFERVGGNRTLKVDVRVIATTNRDITRSVESGEFRRDLYFRLNVVPVKIPPLRERKGEIEFLLQRFIERAARKHNHNIPAVHPLVIQQLTAYPWPGNVRELQNCVERALILSGDKKELEFGDFMMSSPPPLDSAIERHGKFPTIEEMERRLIGLALKETGGNRNCAAEMLGINVRTLRNKLSLYARSGVEDLPDAPGNEEEDAVPLVKD